MRLTTRVKMLAAVLPAPALIALAGLALFTAGRCTGSGPAKPSRDSAALANYAKALDSAAVVSAKRDSTRNAAFDSVVAGWAEARLDAQQRLVLPPKPVQPPGTASDSTAFLLAYSGALEAANADLRATLARTVAAGSEAVDSLTSLFHEQQGETARLRDLLAGAADSLAKAAVRIGSLERSLRSTRGGTHFGVVASAAYAGGCWTGLAGLEAQQRGHFLFLEGSASVAGGLGIGGCGRIPTSTDQAKAGAAGRVELRVGI